MKKEKKEGFPKGKLAKAKRSNKKTNYWTHDFKPSFEYGRAYCIKFLTNVGRKMWNKYKWKLYTIIFVLTLMLWAEYMACGTIGEYCLGFE